MMNSSLRTKHLLQLWIGIKQSPNRFRSGWSGVCLARLISSALVPMCRQLRDRSLGDRRPDFNHKRFSLVIFFAGKEAGNLNFVGLV
jgi:hypothetical protein